MRQFLLMLALGSAPTATGFYFCVPISGTRSMRPTGASSPESPRPLSAGPLAFARRRAQRVAMDAGEDLDQLDRIPGMRDTGSIGMIQTNATSTTASSGATAFDIRFGGITFGPGDKINGDVHAIFPTRGGFDLPPIADIPAALPEYSLEDEAAAAAAAAATAAAGGGPNTATTPPRDHAASAAAEIARKIAAAAGGFGGLQQQPAPSSFRATALKSVTDHVEIRERRAAEGEAAGAAGVGAGGAAAGTGTGRAKAPAGIDSTRVPNLWLAVAHSSSVKFGKVTKVEVDGVPIALWRTAVGAVAAQSDVCIHRGASLARGWIANDRLVCPYHGFEFESNGKLAYMPGAGPPKGKSSAAKAAAAGVANPKSCSNGGGGRKAPTYPVKEIGGWIYVFPDATRPGSVEQYRDPIVIPEAVSPEFRAIQGSMDMKGGVDACVENMLDMLHISFVHSFGNQQDPTPSAVSYERGFDDPGTDVMATQRVTFRYRSGSRSFSKVVGKSTEVVVKNEFHLPYRAVIRVYFGRSSVKTIEATAVPKGDGETTLHWKLYRNFAITHPLDDGPINKAGDFLFKQMMDLTLREDKEIIENVYPEYQHGFMNARYDQQMLQYRKAIADFQAAAAERANTQLESSLQMELLSRISRSQRGLASSRDDRTAILDLIRRLEEVQATSSPPLAAAAAAATPATTLTGAAAKGGAAGRELAAQAASAVEAAEAAAAAAAAVADEEEEEALKAEELLEGQWHLEYMSKDENGMHDGWDFAASSDVQKEQRIAALKDAGGEALLFDWKETGRPLWADTDESVQIIDTKARTLTNRAVYKGWSGFTTTVQLDAVIEPLQDQANRLMVGFRKAIVNVGGMKVTFPHLQRFSPMGWMETTYLNTGIRIARGNKGSIYVLTRHPVSKPPGSPPSPLSPAVAAKNPRGGTGGTGGNRVFGLNARA